MGEFLVVEINLAYLRKNLRGWSKGSGKNLLRDEGDKVGKIM